MKLNFHETPPREPLDKEEYNFLRSDVQHINDDSTNLSQTNLLQMSWDPTILDSNRGGYLFDHNKENITSLFQSMNIVAPPTDNSNEPLTFNEDNTRNSMLVDMYPSMMFPQTSKFFNDMSLQQPNQPIHGMSSLYFHQTGPSSSFQNIEQELESHGPENNYLIYPKYPTNINYHLVIYFIEGTHTNNGDTCYVGHKIFTKIIHPSGIQCHVNVEVDSKNHGRYICSFHSLEPGIYMAYAHLHNGRDVKGSPLKIYISRSYCKSLARTVLSFQTKRERIFGLNNVDESPSGMSWGIDVDRFSNNICVANKESSKIQIFKWNGILLNEICGKQYFDTPNGIAVDEMNHRIIVSDNHNHRICFFSLDGQFIKTFGNNGFKNSEFNSPWGIAISPNGELIAVADSKNHRIQLFDKNGNFLRKYSEIESNPYEYKKHFDNPRGICFDNTGQYIYVSDFNLNTIFKLNIELTEKDVLVPRGILRGPQGLVIDIIGNLLICDSRNNRICVISSSGAILGKRNGPRFIFPQNISILRGGLLIILDSKGVVNMY